MGMTSLSFVGSSGIPEISVYDKTTGLYYKSYAKGDEGFMKKGSMCVPHNGNRDIRLFVFEQGIKDGEVQFSGLGRYVSENYSEIDRELKDKILFGWDEGSKALTLFTCTKAGKDIAKLVVIPRDAAYHIDVRNSQLRVVKQVKDSVSVKSYAW